MGWWYPAVADDGGWGILAPLTGWHLVETVFLSALPLTRLLNSGLETSAEDGNAVFEAPLGLEAVVMSDSHKLES